MRGSTTSKIIIGSCRRAQLTASSTRAIAKPTPSSGRYHSFPSRSNTIPNRPYLLIASLSIALAYIAAQRSVKADDGGGAYIAPSADPLPITVAELALHNNEKSLWVAVDGAVYDVTDFAHRHPGGKDILLEHAGQDVTEVFRGIHPAGTLAKALRPEHQVGRLDTAPLPNGGEEPAQSNPRANIPDIAAVIDLSDFETIAKPICSESAWDYYTGASESRSAYEGNAEAFRRVFFRPRVMRNVTEVDTAIKILGYSTPVPFFVSPTARNGLAAELGEIAVTRGAGTTGMLQVLSHVASRGIEEVMPERAPGQEVAWQLYMKPDRALAETEIRRAVELGAQSIWLTVDTPLNPNHTETKRKAYQRRPTISSDPIPTTGPPLALSQRHDPGITWKDVKWIKSIAPGIPVVLKGIGAWEDAVLAKQHGADGIVLSNHGGRALDYANAPLRTLRDINTHSHELIEDKDFSIFLDGGVRSGTDIIKALCLGANGVGLGRPFIYAAAGYGQQGVEKAVLILRAEMERTMRQLGVVKLDQLGPDLMDISRL